MKYWMRRGGLLFTIVIATAIVVANAEAPFLQDHSRVWMRVNGMYGITIGWVPPELIISSGVVGHYETKYGLYPDMVLWTDIGISTYTFDYSMYVHPEHDHVFESWDPLPVWEDIEEHFMVLRENMNTSAIDTFSAAEMNGVGSLEMIDDYRNAYRTHMKANLFDLIPVEKDLYRSWSELWSAKEDPGTKVANSDTVYFLKSPRETPYDSLQWVSSIRGDEDIDFFHEVYRSFPENEYVNRNLFNYYYMEANCDSVTAIGERLIIIESQLENRSHIAGGMPYGVIIESKIHDICVDGYPQLEKYRDPGFYYDPEE